MPAPGFAPGSLAVTYAEIIGVQRVALTLYGRWLEPLDQTMRCGIAVLWLERKSCIGIHKGAGRKKTAAGSCLEPEGVTPTVRFWVGCGPTSAFQRCQRRIEEAIMARNMRMDRSNLAAAPRYLGISRYLGI